MKRHMSWDLIQLEYISQDTGLFKEFKELQNYGLKTKTAETKKSPHIMINSNWLTYYDSIPKSFRKHIDSRHRRSERDYVVELERINGDLLDELALDEAFAIEDSGWKGRNGSSVLKNPMAKQFYYSLAFTLNRKNWFELLFLKLSGKRVAFDYNLIYDACYNMVKIGYDEQYKRYSIGNVLRKLVIMNAFQNNYKKYDFLGAADDYKTKLANSADVLHKVFIFNANPISKCLKFLLFDAGELADSLGIKRHYSRIKPLIWGFSR
ncbi:MAG: GNAT family N-acetyltransferase [Proteobacteria bacterium]|nr:GNAT family N-acetyltransferase [Pseudomonadota bacterium]MBU4260000.1 GNAT family N-acetyltransferase [Pseudomonadota bacterium]MBU4287839.1 GNAT family N-acetyltransferase [Pseudomonadota bacterium]MCG2829906.1 GNAT family N-acetyltransferase [Desulfobacteraceae bacterium]